MNKVSTNEKTSCYNSVGTMMTAEQKLELIRQRVIKDVQQHRQLATRGEAKSVRDIWSVWYLK